jgi:hypothetical protein
MKSERIDESKNDGLHKELAVPPQKEHRHQ